MIEDTEFIFDRFLNIDTSVGTNDDNLQRKIFTQYQPAHYSFLEYLFHKYPFSNTDCLVDFGAGKGRPIIMAAYYGCKHIMAYELDEVRAKMINDNVIRFKDKFKLDFQHEIFCMDASNATIRKEMNKFFFFSPFHLKIYVKILKNVVSSLTSDKRPINIYLYGPEDSVIKYIDSLKCFRQKEVNRYCKTVDGKSTENYEYVIYSSV